MGICGSSEVGVDKQAVAINAKIEAQNKKDVTTQNRIIKLLLLGAGESGKSTLFKQISILNGQAPTKSELEETVPVIHMNVFNNMILLIEYALEKGIEFGETRKTVDDFMQKYDKNSSLDEEAVVMVKEIWNSEGGKTAWAARAEYQVLDALQYFINSIDRIAKPGYLPTQDDFIHSRVRSTGIVERTFKIKGVNFRITDVGGQRNERRKWIHCFDNVTAIIFMAAINEYDQKLYEDARRHRIKEALSVFAEVLENDLFSKTPIILFLNKVDLFRQKMQEKPLQSAYPDFEGPYLGDEGVDAEEAMQAGMDYMRDKFLAVNQEPSRVIYHYFTTATDQSNIDKVFNSTRDIVLQQAIQGQFF